MPTGIVIFSLVLCVLLIWISYTDIQSLRIPDLATLLVFFFGLLSVFYLDVELLAPHLFAGLLGSLVFFFVGWLYARASGRIGLGFGDVKLIGAIGLWVGPVGLPSVIFLSATSGIVAILLLRALRKRSYEEKIPFGPFIATAGFWVWVFGAM